MASKASKGSWVAAIANIKIESSWLHHKRCSAGRRVETLLLLVFFFGVARSSRRCHCSSRGDIHQYFDGCRSRISCGSPGDHREMQSPCLSRAFTAGRAAVGVVIEQASRKGAVASKTSNDVEI
jgi:hypothetical protein